MIELMEKDNEIITNRFKENFFVIGLIIHDLR